MTFWFLGPTDVKHIKPDLKLEHSNYSYYFLYCKFHVPNFFLIFMTLSTASRRFASGLIIFSAPKKFFLPYNDAAIEST